MISLLDRLNDPRPILLDGATGTELNRRDVDTALPLWSARALLAAPEKLSAIHREYVDAGAEILTANTFRTNRRSLSSAGLGGRAAELTRQAVDIAREAADGRAWVVGSQPPLEDCYSPQLIPPDRELRAEHAEMAKNLAVAGVDGILVETQNTIREAVAATEAAASTGLPVLVSFVCGNDGRLLSGETLFDAVHAVLPANPLAVLVNCVPAEIVLTLLEELRSVAESFRRGAYANIGRPDPAQGWINTDAENPVRYAEFARHWLVQGAGLIGGCCGTTPEHVRRLRKRIESR